MRRDVLQIMRMRFHCFSFCTLLDSLSVISDSGRSPMVGREGTQQSRPETEAIVSSKGQGGRGKNTETANGKTRGRSGSGPRRDWTQNGNVSRGSVSDQGVQQLTWPYDMRV